MAVGAILAAMLPGLACASGERHIPRGELNPQIIEKVFDSPVGEIEFTAIMGVAAGAVGHSGFLRNVRGSLMGFSEVRGAQECETWFMSGKTEAVPRSCEFFFYDESDGRTLSVRSDELEETTLFQVARGTLRGWRKNAGSANGGQQNVSL